jgi:arsenical pump membrane protein
LGHALEQLSPTGSDLLSLLAMTAIAAVLANVVNNIPATVALLPLVSGHPASVLAMLIGVNVGPNATYAGSLATLLWRRLLGRDSAPRASQFHRYGSVTVVPMMAVSATLLWLGVQVMGV